jgi:hypothetical protein
MRASYIMQCYVTEIGVRNGDDRHPLTTKSQNPLHLALSMLDLVYKDFLKGSLAEMYPVTEPCDLSPLLTM